MGTATAVDLNDRGAQQFRGVFDSIRIVTFTVDVASMNANAIDATEIAVPGLDQTKDFVIGWTHNHAGSHSHEYVESFHTWTDELHFIAHNTSGAQLDPPVATYRVIIARLA